MDRLLRVCPSKNVEIMARFCWIALGFDTFSHETIWSWSSRVWVGLCPLNTSKVSFSRKTRFWGRFLVLKAPTNLNCDHSTPNKVQTDNMNLNQSYTDSPYQGYGCFWFLSDRGRRHGALTRWAYCLTLVFRSSGCFFLYKLPFCQV